MGKGRFFGKFAVVVAVGLALSGVVACGTANDQGISFRIAGWLKAEDDTTPSSGEAEPLACTNFIEADAILENNLVQGIRVDRIDYQYLVPAGQLQIPPESDFVGSVRLGPSSNQEPNNPPRQPVATIVVSGQLIEFLNDNRDRLPPLPFRMIVRARAVGVTDAGDVFRTNESRYPIEFLDDEACEVEEEEEDTEEAA